MAIEIPHVSPATPASEIHALLEERGVVVIDSLVSPDTLRRVSEELAPWLALADDQSPLGHNAFSGFKTLRTSGLIGKSKTCGELAMHALVLDVVDRVLGPQCARFQIGVTQAIRIGTGEKAQPVHRDSTLYPFKRPGPEVFINSIWAAEDFTLANGATRFYPGSHRWDDSRIPGGDDVAVAAEMTRGSVVIYYGSTYHGGGANVSDRPRTGILFGYILGWLRQEENQYLAVPLEKARTLPPELQRLIGYADHNPLLGFYEGLDPDVHFGGTSRQQYGTALEGSAGKSVKQVVEEGKAGARGTTRR